jgi:hypothetical protein
MTEPSISSRAQALYQRLFLALGDKPQATLSLTEPEMRALLQCEGIHPQVATLNSHVVYPAIKKIQAKTGLRITCDFNSASGKPGATPSYSFSLERKEHPVSEQPQPASPDWNPFCQWFTPQNGRDGEFSPPSVRPKLILSLPPDKLAIYYRLRSQIHAIATDFGIGIEEELSIRSSETWEAYVRCGYRPAEPEPPKPRRSLLSRLFLPWRR